MAGVLEETSNPGNLVSVRGFLQGVLPGQLMLRDTQRGNVTRPRRMTAARMLGACVNCSA